MGQNLGPVVLHQELVVIKIIHKVLAGSIGAVAVVFPIVHMDHRLPLTTATEHFGRTLTDILIAAVSVQIGTAGSLQAVLIVHKQGQRGPGSEMVRQGHRLTQGHHSTDPAAVDQISTGEIRALLDQLVVCGGGVNMFIMAEFGVNTQIGSIFDSFLQSLLTAGDHIPLHIQFKDTSIRIHGVQILSFFT